MNSSKCQEETIHNRIVSQRVYIYIHTFLFLCSSHQTGSFRKRAEDT